MDKLIKQRSSYKKQLTRFQQFLEEPHEENTFLEEVATRYTKAELLWDKYEDIQTQIEQRDDTGSEEERKEFEVLYFKVISSAKTILKTTNSQNSEPSSNSNQNSSKLNLPILKIPSFDGSFDDWLPFFDLFTSVIDSNETLKDIEKLHYLRSSLRGEALHSIESLELTSTNYKVAWQLVQERYNNKNLIVQKHVQSLFNISKIQTVSVQSLRELMNSSSKHIRALAALGEPTDQWDTLLIHLISSKFDSVTYEKWQSSFNTNTIPNMTNLNAFLINQIQILETINFSLTTSNNSSQNHHTSFINVSRPNSSRPFQSKSESQTIKCKVCNSFHNLYQCDQLLKMSAFERIDKIKSLNLCTNCLKYHKLSNCSSTSVCKHCGKRHNTILCIRGPKPQYKSSDNQTITNSSNQALTTGTNNSTQCTQIILSTVLVDVISSNGKHVTCRALLDSGSQTNFISEDLCKKLQLKKTSVSLSVTGINCSTSSISSSVKASIRSKVTSFSTALNFLVLGKLTDKLPSSDISDYSQLCSFNLPLADPTFFKSSKIDMILGAEIFWDLLCENTQKVSDNGPIFRETKLGWILTGSIVTARSNNAQSYFINTSLETLNSNIQKFWDLDQVSTDSPFSGEDLQCENNFKESTTRNSDGRYVVQIPLKENPSILGDTKALAVKRFLSLENRLIKSPELYANYKSFLQEYESLGHMELQGEFSNINNNSNGYFIPHHCVIKESSSTTKLRVVFDCSAKSTSGLSLNDISMTGPRIQDDLFSIMSRFRMHRYVFSADIEKMYRQILIDPSQHSLQSIIWRENKSEPLKVYNLKTVTYGSSSAPFLATRTLQMLATDESQNFPITYKTVLRDFYVDDVLTGSHSMASTLKLKDELVDLLHRGGFHLRKWSSNFPELLSDIPKQDIEVYPHHHFDTDSSTVKTLGLMWDTAQDVFKYAINLEQNFETQVHTKRTVFSLIAKLFDPLGLIGPIILSAKLMMQQLWREGIDWDDKLPSILQNNWKVFYNSLTELNHFTIHRFVLSTYGTPTAIQLCGFSDASTTAYGACVYLRSEYDNGQTSISLLASRSRVAPIKVVSLPRLELCAALLLVQLTDSLKGALNISDDNIYYYTDSTIVLSWLKQPSTNYNTFVSNRVSKIQTMSDINHWNHVSTHENPADLISRGSSVQSLVSSTLWWKGPLWLTSANPFNLENYQHNTYDDPHLLPELRIKPSTVSAVLQINGHDIFHKFSSFKKLIRVMAYCLRFIENSKKLICNRQKDSLTVDELNSSHTKLIRLAQEQSFSEEITSLKKNGFVQKTSKLLQLNPFLDGHGVIRVGGRLGNSNFTPDIKHPIVLDHKHKLTRLIAIDKHIELHHCGPQLLLNVIREKYWPLNGRYLVRHLVHSCITCFKAKPKLSQQLMGQLPQCRVEPSRPFFHTGLDYLGPVYIRTNSNRKAGPSKAYIALFICLSVKAIHLEVVEDLTTDSFIAALKRFMSRRGKPSSIHSDNAKTFVGANKELAKLKELWLTQKHVDSITSFLANQGIAWSFIPPQSPNFGGLWESGVKLVKHHLTRVTKNTNLKLMEMITLLNQIEACVNSRPIIPLSSDPSDLIPLTPAHFLIGDLLLTNPEPDLTHLKLNNLSRWQHVQQITQHFWKRWNKEYIYELQKMLKWNTQTANVKNGDLMLIKDNNLLPCEWKLGRVLETHPGNDGLIRVVTLKTKEGIFKRSISNLCPLPTTEL